MEKEIPHQVIYGQAGEPLFVVVPYEDYLGLRDVHESKYEVTFPAEVTMRHVIERKSLARSWREHLDKSEKEIAEKLGITLSELLTLEAFDNRLDKISAEKLASVMGIQVEQLESAFE